MSCCGYYMMKRQKRSSIKYKLYLFWLKRKYGLWMEKCVCACVFFFSLVFSYSVEYNNILFIRIGKIMESYMSLMKKIFFLNNNRLYDDGFLKLNNGRFCRIIKSRIIFLVLLAQRQLKIIKIDRAVEFVNIERILI